MANRVPPPPREVNWGRMLRQVSFWALLIVGGIALIQFAANRSQEAAEISYTAFTQELDRDNIAAVEITERLQVKGTFRHAIVVGRQNAERFTTLLPFESSDTWIATLRTKGVEVRAKEIRPSFGLVLVQFLPYLLILGMIIFMLRQMQQGGNRAFAFGKSKAKLLAGDTPKVTFTDVAGCDEAKQELEEIIDFLKDPQKFQRLGGRLPKGALLVGPPGTGKTLLAKAVAGEAGRPFFSMSGSDFVEMFVGVGASRVRDLFEQGKAHAPCIIFIDEIDAVGRHRGAGLGGGHDEREQTLNQLLVEMDGFDSKDGVILVAATNRPDVLDPALLRPGRFDRRIVVPRPDLNGRLGILKVHTKKVPMDAAVDLLQIARGTPGFAGADIENLVNEAALYAARRNKEKVAQLDFEFAKDKVLMGTERRSMIISDAEKRTTAIHEAGHALVARIIPGTDPVHKVTIIPRGRALGLTQQLPQEDRLNINQQFALNQIAILMGGRIAEEIAFDQKTTGAGNDIEQATHLARAMVCEWGMSEKLGPLAFGKKEGEVFLGREMGAVQTYSEQTAQDIDAEVRRIVTEQYQRAKRILLDNRALLDKIAGALIEYETLDASDIDVIMAGGTLDRPPPQKTPPGPPPGKDAEKRKTGLLQGLGGLAKPEPGRA